MQSCCPLMGLTMCNICSWCHGVLLRARKGLIALVASLLYRAVTRHTLLHSAVINIWNNDSDPEYWAPLLIHAHRSSCRGLTVRSAILPFTDECVRWWLNQQFYDYLETTLAHAFFHSGIDVMYVINAVSLNSPAPTVHYKAKLAQHFR